LGATAKEIQVQRHVISAHERHISTLLDSVARADDVRTTLVQAQSELSKAQEARIADLQKRNAELEELCKRSAQAEHKAAQLATILAKQEAESAAAAKYQAEAAAALRKAEEDRKQADQSAKDALTTLSARRFVKKTCSVCKEPFRTTYGGPAPTCRACYEKKRGSEGAATEKKD
jgi:DNA repair exonuclease SbcCD ATPase subunit